MSSTIVRYIAVGIASFVAGGISVGVIKDFTESYNNKKSSNNVLNEEIPELDNKKMKYK